MIQSKPKINVPKHIIFMKKNVYPETFTYSTLILKNLRWRLKNGNTSTLSSVVHLCDKLTLTHFVHILLFIFYTWCTFRPQNDCRCRDRIRQKSARCHHSNCVLPKCFCAIGTPNLHGCAHAKMHQKLPRRVGQKVQLFRAQPWRIS